MVWMEKERKKELQRFVWVLVCALCWTLISYHIILWNLDWIRSMDFLFMPIACFYFHFLVTFIHSLFAKAYCFSWRVIIGFSITLVYPINISQLISVQWWGPLNINKNGLCSAIILDRLR